MRTYRHNPYNPCVLTEGNRFYTSVTKTVVHVPCSRSSSLTDMAASFSCGETSIGSLSSCAVSPCANAACEFKQQEPKATKGKKRECGTDAVANHYKTRMCKTFERDGFCSYEAYCRFAHGDDDLRTYAQNVRTGLTTEAAVRAYQDARAKYEGCGKYAQTTKRMN